MESPPFVASEQHSFASRARPQLVCCMAAVRAESSCMCSCEVSVGVLFVAGEEWLMEAAAVSAIVALCLSS